MIKVDGLRIAVTTRTTVAAFDAGRLIELRRPAGANLLAGPRPDDAPAPLKLLFAHDDRIALAPGVDTQIICRKLNGSAAEYRLHGWSADGVIRISECPQSGDVLVEPSAYSSRLGLVGCRFNIAGIAPELRLVAPLFQGIRLETSDPLIRDRNWEWPMAWEAGLVILQGASDGFSVQVHDTAYCPKALQTGTSAAANLIGLQTNTIGPIETQRAAGGLVWRISAHEGDWRQPAGRYRQWLFDAYGLKSRAAARHPWMNEIRLAGCWLNADLDVLDALAEKVSPKKVLLHLSDWRNFGYDENYPDFTPSPAARTFMNKAHAMGFHIMPHCNSVDMDPSHPVFPLVRDFVYLDPVNKTPGGWAWRNGWMPVPTSNKALVENRSAKVMAKIHPGLSMWRSLLAEAIESGLNDLETDTVFIDVTSCTWNLHNALVENVTCTEGMKYLIDQIAAIAPGLAVGGEGLNEVTAQGLTFAQAHLFRSHQTSIEGLERTAGTAVNAFLFEGLTRTIGYSDLSGKTETSQLRMKFHHSLGAIPTFTRISADQIRDPNRAIAELFEMATSTR